MVRLIGSALTASLALLLVLLIAAGCSEEEFISDSALLPSISVKPESVIKEFSFGNPTLTSPYLQVRSSDASKQLRYEAHTDANWLLIPIDTGTTPDSFSVKISTTGLSDGTYIDSVSVSSGGAENSPVYSVFQLDVITSLVVSPGIVTSWHSQADTLYPDTVIIESGGGVGFSAINWEATHNTPTWLTLSKYSGITPDTLEIIYYVDSVFEIGSHHEVIEFSSKDVRGTATVDVRMNISSWTKQDPPSGSVNDLKSVSFVDESCGWAVMFAGGAAQDETVGIVIKTEDGGSTWTHNYETNPYHPSPTQPVPRGLGGVFFVDRSNGWAVGQSGTIVHTSDGGDRWEYQAESMNLTDDLHDVYFASSTRGWAVGKNGLLVRTEDGGANWTGVFIDGNPDLSDIMFENNLNGWFVGNRGTIQYTTNGGSNWQESSLPNPYSLSDLRAISFIDSDTGWVVGESGLIAKSTDGGLTWTPLSSGTTESFEDVEFVNGGRGWVVGNHSTVLFTTDGGVGWQRQDFAGDTTFWFHALDFVNSTTGWVVGDDGIIFKGRFAGKK